MPTTDKPTADLRVSVTPNRCHRYELFVGDRRIWLTHALPTAVERDGAKGRKGCCESMPV